MKMPRGTEVGLGPVHIVLDGNLAPHKKMHSILPLFGPCLLRPSGWMDQGATWYGGKPRPRHIVLDGRYGDPAPLLKGA